MSLKARIAAYDKAAAEARAAALPAQADTVPEPVAPSSLILDGSAIDDEESLSPYQDSTDSYSSGDASSSAHHERVPSKGDPHPCRPNEHLAVLIPRELWKPDRLASHCDKYACRTKFSLFERKHHCRKCGGVFCHQCSTRTTSLLDTTHLPFLLPPKATPIVIYASPISPVHIARVCDDCYEQLYGYPTPRPASSSSSLSSRSIETPPPVEPRPLFVRAHTYHYLPRPVKTTKLEGDLDRYPLKDPSATCKAAGGGRWSPAPIPPRWDARLPDGRIRHEAEAEKRAAAQRRRQANPVIVDGPIRVRRPRKQQHRDTSAPASTCASASMSTTF